MMFSLAELDQILTSNHDAKFLGNVDLGFPNMKRFFSPMLSTSAVHQNK